MRAKKQFLTLAGTASFPEAKDVVLWSMLVWEGACNGRTTVAFETW
jgi:hypothetical protein